MTYTLRPGGPIKEALASLDATVGKTISYAADEEPPVPYMTFRVIAFTDGTALIYGQWDYEAIMVWNDEPWQPSDAKDLNDMTALVWFGFLSPDEADAKAWARRKVKG